MPNSHVRIILDVYISDETVIKHNYLLNVRYFFFLHNYCVYTRLNTKKTQNVSTSRPVYKIAFLLHCTWWGSKPISNTGDESKSVVNVWKPRKYKYPKRYRRTRSYEQNVRQKICLVCVSRCYIIKHIFSNVCEENKLYDFIISSGLSYDTRSILLFRRYV